MVLALTVPNSTAGQQKPLLQLGTSQAEPATVADVVGASEVLPLTNAFYVDSLTSVPAAQRDGSILRPFATIGDALAELSSAGGTLLIVPGTYAEIVNVEVPGGVHLKNIGAVGRTVSITGVIGLEAVQLTGIDCPTVNVSAAVRATNCSFTNFTAASATLENVSMLTLSVTGFCSGRNVNVGAGCTVGQGEFWYSTLSSGVVANAGSLTLRFCLVLSGAITCSSNADFLGCRLLNTGSAIGIGTQLTTDFASISGNLAALTFGTIVLAMTAPRITLSVVVPAVAAGQVGYVNVALGATKLKGLCSATSLIVANPTTDLVAAGAGGGFINVRFQAVDSIRFAFVGPLAGGAANFSVGVV